MHIDPSKLVPINQSSSLIENYSFFDAHPECVMPSFEQGETSTCSSLAVSLTFSYRLCLNSGKPYYLNPNDLYTCDYLGRFSNIFGYHEQLSWRYIQFHGLPNASCASYNKTTKCNHFSDCKYYRIKQGSAQTFIGEQQMQEEILKNGPITAVIEKLEDFNEYKGGIYRSSSEDSGDTHSVVIIGWGVENLQKYWIIQNSYGNKWGENGLFRIPRGENYCGVESYGTAGKPNEPIS